MRKMKFLYLALAALILAGGIAAAQPLGLRDSIPDEAIKAVEKYISTLGKGRIEDIDRLGNTTFLFVARVMTDEVGGANVAHYIITTKYTSYKIVYDGLEK